MKVAITGSTGLVGSRILELLKNKFAFIALKQPGFDLFDKLSITTSLDLDFDLLLHLAAYTNVDAAETNRELCSAINIQGTRNLLSVVQAKHKPMIYISTDFVFDGNNPPYYEYSAAGNYNNLCFYGQTKYEAEQIIKNKAMIVRISYPYRKEFEPKKDFVRLIKFLLETQKEINMVNDSIITPTLIDDIALGLEYLINNFRPEIYHLVGSSSHTPYEAGQLVANTFALDTKLIKPISAQDYFKNKAKRPLNNTIRSNKNSFYPMSDFSSGLKKIV